MSGYDGPYDLLSRHWELLEGCQEGTNQNSATPDNDFEQEEMTQRLSCKSCYRRKTKCSLLETAEPMAETMAEPMCETCSQRGWTCEPREPKMRPSQVTSCWPCRKGKSKCVRFAQTATCAKCSRLGKDCIEFEPEPASPSDEGSQTGDTLISQEAQPARARPRTAPDHLKDPSAGFSRFSKFPSEDQSALQGPPTLPPSPAPSTGAPPLKFVLSEYCHPLTRPYHSQAQQN